MNKLQTAAKNILLAVDQLGNTLLLGSADETISARCYRRGTLEGSVVWRYFGKFVNTLFWFEPEHCEQAYYAEQNRCHMPDAYQEFGTSCNISSKETNHGD